MPVRALEAIGGFAGVRNLLAEDQAIGLRVRKAGYAIRLSHHVIDNVNQDRDFYWFLNRHSRWYKIRRRLALSTFLAEPMTNLATIGLVWALSGESGIAWGGLVVLVGLGMARDAIQTRWLRGSFPKFRHLMLSPMKDLFLLPVWFDALLNRRVLWRGHRFLIGRYTRLRQARVPLDRPPKGPKGPPVADPRRRSFLRTASPILQGTRSRTGADLGTHQDRLGPLRETRRATLPGTSQLYRV